MPRMRSVGSPTSAPTIAPATPAARITTGNGSWSHLIPIAEATMAPIA